MERIKSIDTIRVIAILAVISLHTNPFSNSVWNSNFDFYLFSSINQFARFAVPFFFVISGYFFSRKLFEQKHAFSQSIQFSLRILLLWAFWSIVYLFPFDLYTLSQAGVSHIPIAIKNNIQSLFENPLQFAMQGSMFHLWFFIALISAALITGIVFNLFLFPKTVLLIIACALYIIGLCGSVYSVTRFGFDWQFNMRNGPFFSTIFFAIGVILAQYKFEPRHFFYGLWVALIGYAIHFLELYYLHKQFDVLPFGHDYVFATLLVALGISIVALSGHQALSSNHTTRIGQYALGIYAVHIIFVYLFHPLGRYIDSPIWDAIYILLVFVASASAAFLLGKIKYIRVLFR